MTISLALRNSPEVSAETRARVHDAAAKAGYAPDPALSILNNYRRDRQLIARHSTLAYVTNWSTADAWRVGFPSVFFAPAATRAAQLGYTLEPFWLGAYSSQAKASHVLAYRGVRGLILAPLPHGPGGLRLMWNRFAAVAVGPTIVRPVLDRVLHDYAFSVQTVLRELRRLGYRRIGLALPARIDAITEHRISNSFIAETTRQAVLRGSAAWLSRDESKPSLLSWIEKLRPDCVISMTSSAHSAWLREGGYRIPKDLGFASLRRLGDHDVSGIDYGHEQIARSAVERVVLRLQQNELGIPAWPQHGLVPGKWSPGATTATRS